MLLINVTSLKFILIFDGILIFKITFGNAISIEDPRMDHKTCSLVLRSIIFLVLQAQIFSYRSSTVDVVSLKR